MLSVKTLRKELLGRPSYHFFVILSNHMLREQSLVLGNLLYLGVNGKPGKTFYKTFYYVDQM